MPRSLGASARSASWERRSGGSRQEKSPQLVTLIGVPGIGKSRLVAELFEAVESDAGADHVAAGAVSPVRGRRHVLGARRDGEGARRDPRERYGGRRDGEADCLRSLRAVTLDRPASAPARRRGGGDRLLRRRPAGGVRRVEEVLRNHRRAGAARARLRRPALGRREPARLHRPSRRLGGRRSDADRVHGETRASLRRGGWGGGKPNASTISLSPLSDDETAELVHALLERRSCRRRFRPS